MLIQLTREAGDMASNNGPTAVGGAISKHVVNRIISRLTEQLYLSKTVRLTLSAIHIQLVLGPNSPDGDLLVAQGRQLDCQAVI